MHIARIKCSLHKKFEIQAIYYCHFGKLFNSNYQNEVSDTGHMSICELEYLLFTILFILYTALKKCNFNNENWVFFRCGIINTAKFLNKITMGIVFAQNHVGCVTQQQECSGKSSIWPFLQIRLKIGLWQKLQPNLPFCRFKYTCKFKIFASGLCIWSDITVKLTNIDC